MFYLFLEALPSVRLLNFTAKFLKRAGSRRNSTISPTSSLASSHPATSANVVLIRFLCQHAGFYFCQMTSSLAATALHLCMKKSRHQSTGSIGNQEIKIDVSKLGSSGGSPTTVTCLFSKVSTASHPA